MSKIITFDFCTIEFTGQIAIATIGEGVHVDYDTSRIITQTCIDYFKNKPFVYITHRKNSYSVDVTKYTYINDLNNLKGFGVISTSLSARNAEIESLFISIPFEIFDTLEEGIKWANTILENDQIEN
ncbi:MAG TPA: hypothetical protein EYO76_14490 [Flavobacteriaceae bacterium]|nr:hypothetical protein [Flavobacteriaceae bacterium]